MEAQNEKGKLFATFSGGASEDVELWTYGMWKAVSAEATLKESARQLMAIQAHLRGIALTWCRQWEAMNPDSMSREDGPQRFCSDLCVRFRRQENEEILQGKLDALKIQGDILAYNGEFYKIVTAIQFMPEPVRVHRYLAGLPKELYDKAAFPLPTRLDDAMARTESYVLRGSTGIEMNENRDMEIGALRNRGTRGAFRQGKMMGKCFICQEPGHGWRRCPKGHQILS
jgi:hypothetical protein